MVETRQVQVQLQLPLPLQRPRRWRAGNDSGGRCGRRSARRRWVRCPRWMSGMKLRVRMMVVRVRVRVGGVWAVREQAGTSRGFPSHICSALASDTIQSTSSLGNCQSRAPLPQAQLTSRADQGLYRTTSKTARSAPLPPANARRLSVQIHRPPLPRQLSLETTPSTSGSRRRSDACRAGQGASASVSATPLATTHPTSHVDRRGQDSELSPVESAGFDGTDASSSRARGDRAGTDSIKAAGEENDSAGGPSTSCSAAGQNESVGAAGISELESESDDDGWGW